MQTLDTRKATHHRRGRTRRVGRNSAVARAALMGLLLFQGLSGLVGGAGLVSDPTGGSLHIPIDWLAGSPFNDYLIPGLFLLLILGAGVLAVAAAVWLRARFALPAALAVGLLLLIWLGVEILVIGYQADPPFQAVYGLVGLSIITLALLPSVRKEYRS